MQYVNTLTLEVTWINFKNIRNETINPSPSSFLANGERQSALDLINILYDAKRPVHFNSIKSGLMLDSHHNNLMDILSYLD